jgi:SAM-dependent methyltransferase
MRPAGTAVPDQRLRIGTRAALVRRAILRSTVRREPQEAAVAYALQLSEAEILRYRHMAVRAREDEADLWALAGIGPGGRVADVGCGPGAIASLVSEVVGATGSVTGIDGDPEAVATARELLTATGATNATFAVGRADATGLAEADFDVVLMRHVLAHNGGAEQRIVDHLASLVRPGGSVFLVDGLAKAMTVHPEPPELADMSERYLRFLVARGSDPKIGVRLPQLLESAGLPVEAFRGWFSITEAPVGLRPPAWAARTAMLDAGLVTEEELERWQHAFEELDALPERPKLFPAIFAAVGRRPLG